MDTKTLERAGRALWGREWLALIADECNWSRRFVERIRSGKNAAPPFFAQLVYVKARQRGEALFRNAEIGRDQRNEIRLALADLAIEAQKAADKEPLSAAS